MQQIDSIAQGQPAEQDGFPLYYREGSFSHGAMLHAEQPGGSPGVDGAPMPYSVGNDDIITLILTVCCLATVVGLSRVRLFMVRQFKTFFYRPAEDTTEVRETTGEIWSLTLLVLVSGLTIAMVCYFYCLHLVGLTYLLPSNYLLIAVFFGLAVVYFLGKMLIGLWVNMVFFGKEKNEQWIKASFFLQAVEGGLMLAVVLLWVYFGLSFRTTLYTIVGVVVLVKILSFGKCLAIFFDRKVVNLHFFLYFCTLEIVPLIALWGGVVFIGNNLKINF